MSGPVSARAPGEPGPPVARLTVEYRGTAFAGWARQRGQRTVQAELERALTIVLRRDRVTLTVAGRTDAGVHASHQVASYIGVPVAPAALNALLPPDIAVLACERRPGRLQRPARRDQPHLSLPVADPARAQRP